MTDSPLSSEIAALRDELRALRQVLDEIREELSWANNNALDLLRESGGHWPYPRITSMSADPAARDFQVNAVSQATVSILREKAAEAQPTRPTAQRSLF